MAHLIAPRRPLLALRNMAAGLTLIITPVLLGLGVAGPVQAATVPESATFVLQSGGTTLGTFTDLASITNVSTSTSGVVKPGKLVLQGTKSFSTVLVNDWEATLNNQQQPQTFILMMYASTSTGTQTCRYEIENAWVQKLQVEVNASGQVVQLQQAVLDWETLVESC